MILITGGAYQGKLEFARDTFNISDDEIFYCTESTSSLDTRKIIINNLDEYIRSAIYSGKDEKYIKSQLNDEYCGNKIIIVTDQSCGIVPLKKEDRLFREALGRITTMLSQKADEVYRVFCGIPQKLK